MVTSESNRVQLPTSTPFERPPQAFEPPAEPVANEPQTESRAAVPRPEPFWLMSLVVAGATMASMWGLSALVLAILGLSGVAPVYILPAAGIVLGLAFVALGAIGTAWARMFQFAERATSRDRSVFFSGVAAAWIAGLAAVVLGILNFVALADVRLLAVAAIILGLGLLWHSGAMQRVSQFTHDVTYRGVKANRPSGPFAMNALSLAPLRDFLVGLGGAILGILAMIHVAPVSLTFVALLVIGGALTLTASTICSAALVALPSTCSKG